MRCREVIEHGGKIRLKALGPLRDVLPRYDFRREVWKVLAARQRDVQLRRTAADLLHALQIGRKLGAFGGGFRRHHPLLIQEPVEKAVGDGPCITLVFDKPVHDGERRPFIAFDKLDRA